MAAHRREPDLTGDQRRRALALLASIPYGLTEEVLVITHGFDRDMIACLVDECLATAEREVVTGPGRAVIEVIRIRITDAGRQALKDRSNAGPDAIAKPRSGLLVAPFRFPADSSPYRHQPVGRHLEFRSAFLNGGGLVRGLDISQPDGLRSYLIDAPSDPLRRRFRLLCHARSIDRELYTFNPVGEALLCRPSLSRAWCR
jgi:hypothetical protein